MWTKAQVSAFQRAMATAESHDEHITRLEQVAEHLPMFGERVRELRIMRDNLHRVCYVALGMDPQGSDE